MFHAHAVWAFFCAENPHQEEATAVGKKIRWAGVWMMCFMVLLGCATTETPSNPSEQKQENAEKKGAKKPQKIKILLDWTPNTNHTGIYAAKEKGYFTEEGLEVEIVPPGMGATDALVASGEVAFGVSYQEAVTFARAEGLPLVSIAAVIQHNTSGFASRKEKNITTPKQFEGKTYGGWGAPVEEATLNALMKKDGADAKKVKTVNVGNLDFFTAIEKDIDFMWIYYGWTGIEAEQRNVPLQMVWLTDYDAALDYYTPVIVTSEQMIQQQPETVRSMVRALTRGYTDAIREPQATAESLLKAEPSLNRKLVLQSADWLSSRYQAEATRWGEQKEKVWSDYADWLRNAGVLKKEFDPQKAFTNEFLPQSETGGKR